MRARNRTVPAGFKVVGTILIIVFPLVIAMVIRPYVAPRPSAEDFVAVFAVVAAGGQAGLIVRRWGNMSMGRLLFDMVLSAVLGAVSYGVVDLAVRRGGGPVDPSLIAVIVGYVLAIWSGQNG